MQPQSQCLKPGPSKYEAQVRNHVTVIFDVLIQVQVPTKVHVYRMKCNTNAGTSCSYCTNITKAHLNI